MLDRAAMVVDDDPRFRRGLARLLAERGFEVSMADSAAAAVEALKGGLPAILFVDLEMPGARGDRLVRALRQIRKDLPIVVCSGTADRDDLVMLLQAGMSDFLGKPFGRTELDACLARLDSRSVAASPRVEPEGATPSGSLDVEGDRGGTSVDPEDLLRRAVENEESIPSMSPGLAEVQALMAQADCGVAEVASLLETDLGVASALLRVSRAPAFGSARPPGTVREACVVLGNQTALCIAHESFAQSMTLKAGTFAALSRVAWRNATVTAHAARLLAADNDELDPEQAFLAGLFHNVGDAVLLQAADRLTRQGHTIETEVVMDLSTSLHERLGGALATAWELGQAVKSIASDHHGVSARPLDRTTKGYLDVVRIAHHLASDWIGPGLHRPATPPKTVEQLDRLGEQLMETVLSLAS